MAGTAGDSGSALSALLAVPLEVVRRIKDDNILLVGMGVAALLVILAIFAPDGAKVYAIVIAAFVLALVIVRAVLDSRKQKDDRRTHAPGGVEVEATKGGAVKDNKMTAHGGGIVARASRGGKVEGNEITTTSAPLAAEPEDG